MKWNPLPTAINPDPLGEPEGEILDPKEFKNHSSLVTCAAEGGKALQKHYPGWAWAIQINQFGRMINVYNHALHKGWGYAIRADEIEHGNAYRAFVRAGGEILERFGLPRCPFNMESYMALPRDFTGQCIPILNDLDSPAAKKELRKRKLNEAITAGRIYTDSVGRVLVNV